MRAKHSPAVRVLVALGLGVSSAACGPIAFNDTVTMKLPEPKVIAKVKSHAKLTGDHIEIDDMIQFEYDSAEIKPVSYEILDDVVKLMQEESRVEQVDIIGHTSAEGKAKYNKKLSQDRAAAVLKYLVDHGIDAGRLMSEGKGEEEPIADNETEEGKIANRRVEFKVTKLAPAPAGDEGAGAR